MLKEKTANLEFYSSENVCQEQRSYEDSLIRKAKKIHSQQISSNQMTKFFRQRGNDATGKTGSSTSVFSCVEGGRRGLGTLVGRTVPAVGGRGRESLGRLR